MEDEGWRMEVVDLKGKLKGENGRITTEDAGCRMEDDGR